MKEKLTRVYRSTRREGPEWELEQCGGRAWYGARDLNPEIKQKLLTNPDSFFEHRPWLKEGNTCSVVQVVDGDKVYVLKRYNQKSLSYRWFHVFSTPRALLNWSNGNVLRSFGVETPRPLACVLIKSAGILLRTAYVLMESVDGPSLSSTDHAKIKEGEPANIPQQFALLWLKLDALNATHGDFKASNLMVDSQDRLVLIDLDSFQFHQLVSRKRRQQKKDMKRFFRNWKDEPEVAGLFNEALKAEGVSISPSMLGCDDPSGSCKCRC